ncbi:MAG TPA: PilZ domain-containing protein [Terriglobales bacterium]|nr:PilZ domain-containing protein [Terriglobales bacterium]
MLSEGSRLPEEKETRSYPRFEVRIPVAARFAGAAVPVVRAQTENVSARGLFFYAEVEISEGSKFEFTLTLPPELTLTHGIPMSGTARVVRLEKRLGTKVGVGACIEEYHLGSA